MLQGILIAFLLFFCLFFCLPTYVLATGGAFPYTKHGGNTTDGVAPYDAGNGPGVDRSVNPDYGGSYYNNLNPEAGKYKGGECTQCHEPHASFGESEPVPVNGTPDPYLLMRYGTSVTNYSELCWYCHENFSNINGSGSPVGMGRWSFYQGKTIFQASSHFNPPAGSFYWPGTGETSSSTPKLIWPRQDRSGLPTGNRGSCLNCHTPHGIQAADAASAYDTTSPDGTGGVPAAMQTVASGNPSVVADYLIPRQLIAWEETLCERCHDASGPSTKNIQNEINKRNTVNQSGHPVDDTTLAGRHVASEALPITTKHVECYDCHNPHAVKAANKVEGMKYIDINGTVQNPATGAQQPYVYRVCFKCHGNSFDCIMPYKALGASDGTAGCTPLATKNRGNETGSGVNDQRGASNKRVEFDPATIIGTAHGADNTKTNGAYHPVYQPGRNTSIQLCRQLQTAFGLSCADQATATAELSNLTIQCTDCHNNNATGTTRGPVTKSNPRTTDKASNYTGTSPIGPHGSTNYRILRANYNTYITAEIRQSGSSGRYLGGGVAAGTAKTTVEANSALCFLCHDSEPFTGALDWAQMSSKTNFWSHPATVGQGAEWTYDYHAAHLGLIAASGNYMYIKCHECHNNMHSNVEANNTQYYSGGACCTNFTSDGNTHLINFGPQASPASYAKPAWFTASDVAGARTFRCNLVCHGMTMPACIYGGGYDSPTYSYAGGC